LIAILVLIAVLFMMLGEAQLARHNERVLRARGATEPRADVYPIMRVAYPACFVAMAIEGALRGPAPLPVILAGLAVFGAAKALKFWAVAALGVRWTFRVLTLPGEPLVTGGPYRYLRHPNYLAVCGEIAGVAIALASPLTGASSLAGFGALMLRRIRIEEAALGLRADRRRD
jgi:methyltransferase